MEEAVDFEFQNVSMVIEERSSPSPDDHRLAFRVFFGITLGICMITSLCLCTLPVLLRRLKSPFFIMLASWSLANLLVSVVEATVQFRPTHSWTLGEFWCHGYFYLLFSLFFTRSYLMVVTAAFLVIGNRRFHQWTKKYAWLRILVPCLVSSFVWILVFLPCIRFWLATEQIEIQHLDVTRYACVLNNDQKQLSLILLFLRYISPIVLTFILLLIWACLNHRPKMVDPIERMQVIIVFILVHAHTVTQAAYIITQVVLSFAPIVAQGKYLVSVYYAGLYSSTADLAISPFLCLVAIIFYRRQLFQSREVEAIAEGSELK